MEITIMKSAIFHRTGRRPFTNYFEAVGPGGVLFTNSDLTTMKQVIRRHYPSEKITFEVKDK